MNDISIIKKRQIDLLKELTNHQGQYVSSKKLSRYLQVSDKTIQSDIQLLKEIVKRYSTTISSKRGFGYQITIGDSKEFESFLSEIQNTTICRNFSDTHSRVIHILFRFFNTSSYLRKDQLLFELFVSDSRMTKDLNIVRDILKTYDLSLAVRPRYGMYIKGAEKNKRRCIVNEKVNIDILLYDEETMINTVGEIVVDELINGYCKLSDVVVQNLIIHIIYIIKRIMQGHFLDDNNQYKDVFNKSKEYALARQIIHRISDAISVKFPENEIINIAIHLKGKYSYCNDTIDNDVDGVTMDVLEEIYERFHINLLNQVSNRIALSLHIIALIDRAKYYYSLKSALNDEIRLNRPLAYDLAVLSAKKISDRYDVEIVEGELGFLAAHFASALDSISNSEKKKRILIIAAVRQGETLLLRHNFLNRFEEYVSELIIINYVELNTVKIEEFDLFFTTCVNQKGMPEKTIKINYFLSYRDINVIQYALLNSEVNINSFFRRDLFVHFKTKKTKEEILKDLCNRTQRYNKSDESLYDSVLQREKLGFTAFGNYVALPHPDHLISDRTSISVAVLDYSITWSRGRNVRIVILLCGGKKQENHLSILFDRIANLIRNDEVIHELLTHPSAETFERLLEEY